MLRRVNLVAFLGLIVGSVFIFGLTAGAQTTDPAGNEVEEAQRRLAELRMDASAAYEAHGSAVFQLGELEQEIGATTEDLTVTEEDLGEAQARLEDRASRMYKSGNVGFVDVLVGAENFNDFSNRLELWVRLLSQERAEFDRVREIRDTLTEKKALLEATRDRRVEAIDEADSQLDQASGLETDAQAYLGSLNEELRAAMEVEQARQAEQARAAGQELRAELAAAEPEAVPSTKVREEIPAPTLTLAASPEEVQAPTQAAAIAPEEAQASTQAAAASPEEAQASTQVPVASTEEEQAPMSSPEEAQTSTQVPAAAPEEAQASTQAAAASPEEAQASTQVPVASTEEEQAPTRTLAAASEKTVVAEPVAATGSEPVEVPEVDLAAQQELENQAARAARQAAEQRVAEQAAAELYAAEKAAAAEEARLLADQAAAAEQQQYAAEATKAERRSELAAQRAAAEQQAAEQAVAQQAEAELLADEQQQASEQQQAVNQPAAEQQYAAGEEAAMQEQYGTDPVTGDQAQPDTGETAADETNPAVGQAQQPDTGETAADTPVVEQYEADQAAKGQAQPSTSGTAADDAPAAEQYDEGGSAAPVAPQPAAAPAPAASGSGSGVVAEAAKYMGAPYVLGGPSICVPYESMDCSCLTLTAFQAFGISLPDDPVAQFGMGVPVSGPPQAGDLVFWAEGGAGITHVGIATGNGTTVHASAYAGFVTETPIDVIPGYVGARRVL